MSETKCAGCERRDAVLRLALGFAADMDGMAHRARVVMETIVSLLAAEDDALHERPTVSQLPTHHDTERPPAEMAAAGLDDDDDGPTRGEETVVALVCPVCKSSTTEWTCPICNVATKPETSIGAPS